MSLPFFTSHTIASKINYEPIYNNLFEVTITIKGIDYILNTVINVNYVNGSLVITNQYDNDNDNSLDVFLRDVKIGNVLDDDFYMDINSLSYNKKGEVVSEVYFTDSIFIGISKNQLHFSYKKTKDTLHVLE